MTEPTTQELRLRVAAAAAVRAAERAEDAGADRARAVHGSAAIVLAALAEEAQLAAAQKPRAAGAY